jgi:hypothetical protein
MGRILRRPNTPIWYIAIVGLILTALIIYGMIMPYVRLSDSVPIESGLYSNQDIYEKSPQNYYWSQGIMDAAGMLLCLFMGLVCFVMGITRVVNKLDGRQIYLLALFLILFGVNFLSASSAIQEIIPPVVLFYTFWLTYFSYAVMLFFYYFSYLSASFQKWAWPLSAIPIGYGAAAWFMYLAFGLPFDAPDKLYTPMMIAIYVMFMVVSLFGVKQRNMIWFFRAMASFWACWAIYSLIKIWLGYSYILTKEFKDGMTVISVFFVSYLFLINMQELSGYKSGMKMLEIKNEFMLENYQTLEKHVTEIAQMKHEMRHHLFAVKELCKNGEHEQLLKYLSDIQEDFAEIDEPVVCDNRVIQAVLGRAARRAKEMMFEIEFEISALPPLTIPDTDMVSLFMNLLDNALESCSHIENPKNRWIKVRLKTRQPYFCLSVTNARQGTLSKSGDAYISTKTDPVLHGHGIEIVRKITEKHGGLASFVHNTDSFTAEVALPAG